MAAGVSFLWPLKLFMVVHVADWEQTEEFP